MGFGLTGRIETYMGELREGGGAELTRSYPRTASSDPLQPSSPVQFLHFNHRPYFWNGPHQSTYQNWTISTVDCGTHSYSMAGTKRHP